MAHNRKLTLGAVALTKAKIRGDTPAATEVRDEIEQLVIQSGYMEGAPFRWVGLILRYGLKNDDTPEYESIDKQDGELPLAIEIDTNEMIGASKSQLKRLFMAATLTALIDAGRTYGLPTSALEERKQAI